MRHRDGTRERHFVVGSVRIAKIPISAARRYEHLPGPKFLSCALGFVACSLLAPPDEHFTTPASRSTQGGTETSNVGGASAGEVSTSGGEFTAGEAGRSGGGSAGTSGADSTSGNEGGFAAAGEATSAAGGGAAGAPVQHTPLSCADLHASSPSLPSGTYTIQPPQATHVSKVYCDMVEAGGGFTLVLNEGVDFMPKTPGTDDAICYGANCTSSVYSTLPLGRDVLIDVADRDIVAAQYAARVLVLGVHAATRGHTLREMFNGGPYFLERGDNSNVTVTATNGAPCEQALPRDFATLLCQTCSDATQVCGAPIITFGDADSACVSPPPVFAIGASRSESEAWTNCAGWPQAAQLNDPDLGAIDFYPTNIRIWIR
jgi:hypothetical protein